MRGGIHQTTVVAIGICLGVSCQVPPLSDDFDAEANKTGSARGESSELHFESRNEVGQLVICDEHRKEEAKEA